MNRMFTVKVALSATISFIGFGMMTSAAEAQSLYEPYYYENREQYQTMESTHLSYQHTSTPDVSAQLDYVPDNRLDPQTNKRLAQGDYPPIPTSVKPKVQPEPSTMPLTTIPGIDFGLQGSGYSYNEPQEGVRIYGGDIGLAPSVTQTFGDQKQYFGTVDFRYAFGLVDYNGSGRKNAEDNDQWEIRGVVGRDFTWYDKYDLSPYLGFGYRYLYNDGRGTTTEGASGYRRESQYFYIPIGVTPRVRFDAASRLSLNLEYDYFIAGQQTSYLGDAVPGDPTVTNQQNLGYGIKSSLMYESGEWAVGPFVNYWNIHQSSFKFISADEYAFEPANNTVEYGLQIKYRFVDF